MCSLLSKMLSGPIDWSQEGFIVFGSVLDLPAECKVTLSRFSQQTHAEQIVSAVRRYS